MTGKFAINAEKSTATHAARHQLAKREPLLIAVLTAIRTMMDPKQHKKHQIGQSKTIIGNQ